MWGLSSVTMDQTCIPAMEAQSLNYWTSLFFFLFVFCFHLLFPPPPIFLLIVRNTRLQSGDLRAFKAETQEDQPRVVIGCILKSLLYPLRDESEENSYQFLLWFQAALPQHCYGSDSSGSVTFLPSPTSVLLWGMLFKLINSFLYLFFAGLGLCQGFPVAQRLKRLPPMWETGVRSLGREDPLEKEMVTHPSILAWRIPWAEKPGRLCLRTFPSCGEQGLLSSCSVWASHCGGFS